MQIILLILEFPDAPSRHSVAHDYGSPPPNRPIRGGAPTVGSGVRYLAYRSTAPPLFDPAALQKLVDRSGVALYHDPPVWGNCGPCTIAYALFGDCTLGSWLRKATIVYARAQRVKQVAEGAASFETLILACPDNLDELGPRLDADRLFDSVCVWLGVDTTWISASFCSLVSEFVQTSIKVYVDKGTSDWGEPSDPNNAPIDKPAADPTKAGLHLSFDFLDFDLEAPIYSNGHTHFRPMPSLSCCDMMLPVADSNILRRR